jgi:voltage-gated potassium channel
LVSSPRASSSAHPEFSFEFLSLFSIPLCVAVLRVGPCHLEKTILSVGALTSQKAVTAPEKLPHRFLSLLITELVLIVGYPFTDGTAIRAEMFRLFAVLVFSAALYAVLGRGRVTIFAFLLGVPAIVIHIANAAHYLLPLQVTSLILGALFLAFVTAIFIWTVVSAPSVTGDTLAGAVAAYLLVGITYGLAYGLIARLSPGSFRDTVLAGKPLQPSEFIFFSFVTLTTVGYGDIVPLSAHARSLVILESVTGIMYPAVLIGRLIGLHSSRHTSS